MRAKKGIADRLEKLGLDVGFLLFLEGTQERLPRLDRLCNITPAKFANAVRAAVWLQSQSAHPERIQPDSPEQWLERYGKLQAVFWNALRQSMTCRRLQRSDDLGDLEEVTKALLPRQVHQQYVADIRKLQRQGQPVRLEDLGGEVRAPKSGGRRQAEQFQRMRAAIAYLRSKSKTPYRDLADLWNEQVEGANYDPDSMRQTLRKGEKAGAQLVEFWMRVYSGDRRAVFPGDYPRSP